MDDTVIIVVSNLLTVDRLRSAMRRVSPQTVQCEGFRGMEPVLLRNSSEIPSLLYTSNIEYARDDCSIR